MKRKRNKIDVSRRPDPVDVAVKHIRAEWSKLIDTYDSYFIVYRTLCLLMLSDNSIEVSVLATRILPFLDSRAQGVKNSPESEKDALDAINELLEKGKRFLGDKLEITTKATEDNGNRTEE